MRTAFAEQFDVPPGYLNTASIGVPPARVADAVEAAVRRWRTAADNPPDFDAGVDTARAAFAALVGVDAAAVSVGASVSQLAGLVAASIPGGSRVLLARGEFTSLTFPFAAQRHRGLELTEVDLAKLPAEVAGHDLVAVSVVQSADGGMVDLDALREAAEAAGAWVLLDVSQAAGWLPLRLDWADWVVGVAYKWLLAPRGVAWLASRPEALDVVIPHAANWYAGEDRWGSSLYGLPLRLAGDARRLDLAPAWLPHVGAAAALPWLASLDLAEVRAHCAGLADALLDRLGLPPRGSAIVSLDLPDAGRRLAEAGVRASARAGRTRLSFHLYNTMADVEAAARALGR
ncbi:aminotransferase class V-fold PLP-dependent enzyme [Gandjariella thermophila]|uniref:Aminotransferase class V n=1 Tax=Gandjariella thermophila TaxID=1931992 RepID=A0A4D4J1M7_9PSEU|nr:aminotransferase class V-fold PLP-dependent enzyme [Gandjariella thermophila]GDY30535.1 aminotransferase class V [Gandjariella thermophila]